MSVLLLRDGVSKLKQRDGTSNILLEGPPVLPYGQLGGAVAMWVSREKWQKHKLEMEAEEQIINEMRMSEGRKLLIRYGLLKDDDA